MFTRIKRQAKQIILKNTVLFTASLLLALLQTMPPMFKPVLTALTPPWYYAVMELSVIIIFPFHIGLIKVLYGVVEGKPFRFKKLFSVYSSGLLLVKTLVLVIVTQTLKNILAYYLLNIALTAKQQPLLVLLLGCVITTGGICAYIYFFLTKYLFVLKPELNIIQIIKQSCGLIYKKKWDLISLTISFVLWYLPLAILWQIIGDKSNMQMTFEYFAYYGVLILYTGGITLYVELAMAIFAREIIEDRYYRDKPPEKAAQVYIDLSGER